MSIATMTRDLYYDPYDREILEDPYPVFKRMRDEAPIYYNEPYDFYAVSRYEDVKSCLIDRDTFSSRKGVILEMIKADIEMPAGTLIHDEPPIHTAHRQMLSRVFTPEGDGGDRAPGAQLLCPAARPARRVRRASTSLPSWADRSRCACSACCSVSQRTNKSRCATTSRKQCVRTRGSRRPTRTASRTPASTRLRRPTPRASARGPHHQADHQRVRGRDGDHPDPDA